MNIMKRLLFSMLLLAVSVTVAGQTVPQFKPGDKVALVGDSITHGGHYHSYVWLFQVGIRIWYVFVIMENMRY